MIHTHPIPIPPTPLDEPIVMVFRVTFDHGVEQTLTLQLERATDDPDHLTGVLTLGTETRVQDVAREG